jgi:hypothetical protein
MVKRALCGVAAALAVATVLAFTVSPISPQVAWAALTAAPIKEKPNTPAPPSAKALKILHADVMKIASDYRHKRYRAVCADLTKKERKHLGGTSQCMMKIALVNAFVPIKKFTIVSAKIGRGARQAAVAVYVNGNRKHVVHAVVKWEGGRYRLDRESGWHPTI